MLFVILQPYRCSDLEIRRKRKLFEPFGDPRVMVYKARISDLDHFSCWSLFTPSCKWCLRTKLSIIWMDQVIIENRELIQRPGWILVKWCHGFRDMVGSGCVMEMKRLKVLDSNLTKSPLQAWFFWIFFVIKSCLQIQPQSIDATTARPPKPYRFVCWDLQFHK